MMTDFGVVLWVDIAAIRCMRVGGCRYGMEKPLSCMEVRPRTNAVVRNRHCQSLLRPLSPDIGACCCHCSSVVLVDMPGICLH